MKTAEQRFLALVQDQLADKKRSALLHQARNTRVRLSDGRHVRLRVLRTANKPEEEILLFEGA